MNDGWSVLNNILVPACLTPRHVFSQEWNINCIAGTVHGYLRTTRLHHLFAWPPDLTDHLTIRLVVAKSSTPTTVKSPNFGNGFSFDNCTSNHIIPPG